MGKKQRQSDRKQPARDAQVQRITTYTGIAVVVLVIAFVGVYLFSNQSGSSGSTDVALSIDGQPTLGPPEASVEVIEFGDFLCPACKAFHARVFPQLKRDYVDSGKIEFAFINFPLPIGPGSWTAADASECVYRQAGNGAFWDYYDAVYVNQGAESQRWATVDFLIQLAQDYIDAEIDTDSLRQCINDQKYRDEVQRDRDMGMTANIPGTPTIFVNGRQMANFGYSTISSAIDEALNKPAE